MKFLASVHYIFWLVLSSLFFAAGEFLSKEFALNPKVKWVILLMSAYTLGTLAWLPAILQKNQLSIVGVLWSVMSLLATVGIGILVFNETVTLTTALGILAAVISITLLSWAG